MQHTLRPGPLPGTAVTLVRLTPDTPVRLHREETRLLNALPAARRADFTVGRMAAARALDALGTSGPVLRDGRRPLFPAGLRGSISHCHGRIGACIASTNPRVITAGVDVERTDRLGRDAARLVCTPRERGWIDGARRPESRLAVLFSVKEAIYKALSGISGREPVFHDAELGLECGRWHIRLTRGLLPQGHLLTGRVRLVFGGHVLSSVVVLADTSADRHRPAPPPRPRRTRPSAASAPVPHTSTSSPGEIR